MYTGGGDSSSAFASLGGASTSKLHSSTAPLDTQSTHGNLSPYTTLLPLRNNLPSPSDLGAIRPVSPICVGIHRDSAVSVDLLQDWETAQYAQSLSVRTVNERIASVRQMAQWCGVAPHLATDREVSLWLAKGGVWEKSTRHTYFTRLNAWFVWLQYTGHRDDNPMSHMKPPVRPKNLPRPPANENLPILLEHANRRRTRAMLLLALCQGLRAMEIAKFRGDDIDLRSGELTVTGKGGRTVVMPLHHRIRDLAAEMPLTFWFPSPMAPGRPVSRKSVSSTLSGVFHRAGVTGTGHSARHWYGTALIESNVDLLTTKELMRHESVASTQIYVKVSKQRKHKGIDRIDPLTAGTSAAAKRRRRSKNPTG